MYTPNALGRIFFHQATSLAEKKPAFVQSLHKMKPHFLALKARISIGFIEDYHLPAGCARNFLQFSHQNDAARRFDWPAFLWALGTRPDKSPHDKPRRSCTQRAVCKSRDSTAVPSAPIFKPPVQCRRKLASGFRLRYLYP